MRALYFAIAVFEGMQIWPVVFHHRLWEDSLHGVAIAMLAALTLLSAIGVRYPLQMLPLMLFEFAWKTIWSVAVLLPAWQAGPLDADMRENAFAIVLGVVLCPLIIPWSYAWANYVRRPGDRWR
jgi:hypothetical protein